MNPGWSVKDRLALAIVDDAEVRGALRPGMTPGMTIVEATAGNTGSASRWWRRRGATAWSA